MKLENAILSLVRVFIARQQIVSDVIQALRPDMFVIGNSSVPDVELIEIMKKHAHVPQIGIWQNDEGIWDYFFHGNGCRLTHQITGEVIDWDALDIEMFDPWKFKYWIKWAVETKPKHVTDEVDCLTVAITQNGELETVVTTILEQLTERKIFERASQGRLHLK